MASSTLLFVEKDTEPATSFVNVLIAVSFTGAVSHPYSAFGSLLHLMMLAVSASDVLALPNLLVDLDAVFILAVRVVPHLLVL